MRPQKGRPGGSTVPGTLRLRAAVPNQDHTAAWGRLAVSGDVSGCHNVGVGARSVSGSAPGVLLNIPQRRGWYHSQERSGPNATSAETEPLA